MTSVLIDLEWIPSRGEITVFTQNSTYVLLAPAEDFLNWRKKQGLKTSLASLIKSLIAAVKHNNDLKTRATRS